MKLTRTQLTQMIKEELDVIVEADREDNFELYRRIYGTRGTEADVGEWVIRNTGAGNQYYAGMRAGGDPIFVESENVLEDERIRVFKSKSKALERKEMIEMGGLQVEIEDLAEMSAPPQAADAELRERYAELSRKAAVSGRLTPEENKEFSMIAATLDPYIGP